MPPALRTDSKESWDEIWYPQVQATWRDYQLPENIFLDTLSGRERRGPAWECTQGPDSIYFDGKIALKSIRDLKKLKAMEKPFFLATGFLKPHLPFNATKKYWDMYDPAEISVPKNDTLPLGLPYHLISNWGELRSYNDIPAEGPVSDSAARKLIHGYYACVSSTDAAIGMLLDELEALDLERSTLVILWGDHGWNLNEHGLWCKHCNFNTSLRTTLMLKVPGKTKGKQTDALVEFIDIYPTLSDLVGIAIPDSVEGKSLHEVLEDPSTTRRETLLFAYRGFQRAVQDRRYKLIEYVVNGERNTQLFDLAQDPWELHSLAGEPAYQTKVSELRRELRRWQTELGDSRPGQGADFWSGYDA